MQRLKKTVLALENAVIEYADPSKLLTYLPKEFEQKQANILKNYSEELVCYDDPEVKMQLKLYFYTGVYLPPKNKAIDDLAKKLNENPDDIIPILADRISNLENLLEPIPHDMIVYFDAADILGISVGSGKLIKSNDKFNPISGNSSVPPKLFSEYSNDEPRNYIIRYKGFLDVFIDYEGARPIDQKIIALQVPKGTKVLLHHKMYPRKPITLFPNATFVLYDTVGGEKLNRLIYIGGVCKELSKEPFLKVLIERLYLDNNFSLGKYGRDFDEQADHARQFFYHVEKSYEENVLYAFPKITQRYIPQKFYGKKLEDINNFIKNAILQGKGKHWTNQQLSYMRKELFSQAIFNKILEKSPGYEPIHIVDTTGNIGGDSLTFALQPEVSWILTYEMMPDTFNLLKNNVDLYGLNKIVPINEKFEATTEKIFPGKRVIPNTVVIIDPPYEYPPGAEKYRFVYSIDKLPLIYMVNDCLKAGAEMVVITVPLDFTFNKDFAINHNLSVECFNLGRKDMKIYMVRKNKPNKSSYFYSGTIKMPVPKKF